MYLTKISVAGEESQSNRLFDVYRWKQELCKSLPPTHTERSFLFRLTEYNNRYEALVLSKHPPMVLPFGSWETRQTPHNFYKKNRFLYDISVNLSKKISDFDENGNRKKQGKRVTRPIEECEKWFREKMERDAGCKISVDMFLPNTTVFQRKGVLIKLPCATIKGKLSVHDHESFERACTNGIGSGKAWGFGLLLLKPF